MSVDAILKEVEALSVEERAELLERLHERFAELELSDELRAELDSRVAEADANPNAGYTWDEVVAYVKRKR
jgi:putative addiction module component (TIGR02574 family)